MIQTDAMKLSLNRNSNQENNINNSNEILKKTNIQSKIVKKDILESLILINAQNTNEYIPPNSNYNLDNYNYEEAIKYEQRSFLRIIFIFLMANEKVLNTFVYIQPLELKLLRISMFLFNISLDFSLNSFFYLSER